MKWGRKGHRRAKIFLLQKLLFLLSCVSVVLLCVESMQIKIKLNCNLNVLTSPKPPFPKTLYWRNVFFVTGCLLDTEKRK